MKFDTSEDTREFIENVHSRVGARNQAILGRAALFLAIGEGVPAEFKPKDAKGVTLNDEQVVGDQLRDLVRAALNYRSGRALDESGYRQEFRRYFEYGCTRLSEIWRESGNDQAAFVTELLRVGGDIEVREGSPPYRKPMPVVQDEVRLRVLIDEPEWSLNGPGTNNGLLVISGQPGTGKSQLALDLLAQLSRSGVRFVFFDMKGELEDDPQNPQLSQNRERFLKETGARHIRLIQERLPINPLYRHDNPTQNAQVAYEIAGLIRCFAPQLGAKQERTIADAFQQLPIPDFQSLVSALENAGAAGVDLAICQKIERLQLFANASEARSVEEWLDGSLVVDFKEFGNDTETKALAVALILNLLIKRLNQNLAVVNGVQPIKMVLFVDEAHLLLPKENRAGLLGALARQGRSWGFPVWLASQDADKFLTAGANETNFAELAECGVHFSPQTLTNSQQKVILGGVIHQTLTKGEATLRLGGKLSTGGARQYWRDSGS